MIDSVPGPTPYALSPTVFPFRSLTLLAGRAPLGGPREVALATLVAVRLAATTAGAGRLDLPLRVARADAARHWMGSVTLAAPVRNALLKLVASTTDDDADAIHGALARVTDITANTLDRAARSELDRLLARLAP